MGANGHARQPLLAARQAYVEGRYADATRMYAAIVAEDGTRSDAWVGLGDARWKRGDRDGAIEAYRRATKTAPEGARGWHNLATVLLAARRFAEAAEAAGRSVELDGGRAKAWNNLAAAREGLGDAAGAQAALREALARDPGLAPAWENLGWLLVEAGRCDEAEAAFRRAEAAGRSDPSIQRGLARCHAGRGDLAAAEERLADAVRTSPGRFDLWLELGDLRLRRGRAAEALEAFEAATGAAAEMGPAARTSVARRATDAALALARDAVAAGDRRALVGVLDRARAAREQAGPTLTDDAGVRAAVDAVVAAAKGGAHADLSPSDVVALVRSRLRVSPSGEPKGGA